MIEKSENMIRVWLDEDFAIRKHKDLKLYYLEFYRFGRNYMPDEVYANEDFEIVYRKYLEVK